jgi:hypothetical protein
MGVGNDFSQIRRRQDSIRAALGQPAQAQSSGTRFGLFEIATQSEIPTTVPNTFVGYPSAIVGAPAEGAPVTFARQSSILQPVIVLGRRVPQIGDHVPAIKTNGRWAAMQGYDTKGTECTNGTVTVQLAGRGWGLLTGYTITASQDGETFFTGTTDAHGKVTFTPPRNGTVTVTFPAQGGFSEVTGTFVFACGTDYLISLGTHEWAICNRKMATTLKVTLESVFGGGDGSSVNITYNPATDKWQGPALAEFANPGGTVLNPPPTGTLWLLCPPSIGGTCGLSTGGCHVMGLVSCTPFLMRLSINQINCILYSIRITEP